MPIGLSPVKLGQLVWPGRGPAPSARLAFPQLITTDNPRTSFVPVSKFYNRVRVNTATLGYDRIILGTATSNAYLSATEAGIADGDSLSIVVEEGTDFFVANAQYRAWDNSIDIIRVDTSKIGGVVGKNRMSLAGAAIVYIDLLKEDLPSTGRVLQCLQATYATNATLTASVPNGVPLISDGTQILAQQITPSSNTNKILCFVSAAGQSIGNVASELLVAGIFRGSICISVGTVIIVLPDTTAISGGVSFSCLDSPGAATPQVYSVRIGGSSTGLNVNYTAYNALTACTMTLMEIAA